MVSEERLAVRYLEKDVAARIGVNFSLIIVAALSAPS
jgi:hypothetical protein